MTDYIYISHNFGKEGLLDLEKFLRKEDLINAANFNKEGITAGLCSIRLPENDNRLKVFIKEIEKTGNKPFIRFDREYSIKEMDNFEYMVLVIKTVGLENPSKKQKYDYSSACKHCGAGVLPISPLLIPKNSMGKKLIDFTAHNNWLIFKKELAERIATLKLSGISFHPLIIGRKENEFQWGRIDNILPKLHPSSKIRFNEAKCNFCENSGNFGNFESETKYIYSKEFKSLFKDFNSTFEFFGEWKYSKMGGQRLVIVNQKVRQFLLQEKVKNIAFVPIEFK
jgi:hypothetical protein